MLLAISFLLFALVLERSYHSYLLQKQLKQLKEQVDHFKKNQEEFTLEINEMNLKREADHHDSLTHLISKNIFDDMFGQLIQQSKRFKKSFALLLLKIDDFENFNQKNSSLISDKLLIEFATRIQPTIRQVDTLTRYAGEMFAVLMPNLATPETAVYVAQRLLDSVVSPFSIEGQDYHLSACVGISIYPYDADNASTLLKKAEDALNKARSNGKNIFQFYQEQTQTLGKHELSLKSMVTSPYFYEQLSLEYVTYINTFTNEEICMEVIPWATHAELGRVPYTKFYKMARNAGQIFNLYEWVLRHAIAHFKSLEKSPRGAPKQLLLTFNLNDIQSSPLMNQLISLIHSLEIPPEKIILELTDNVDEINQESLQQSLGVLRDNHIQVAIGIFVLGHFALKKITNLPIQYLKINNELIKDFHTHLESQGILERLLSLAKKMEIGVLTEGVSKEEQKKRLQELGCYVMQGEIIHKKDAEEVVF